MIKPRSVLAYSLIENLTPCNRTSFSVSVGISFEHVRVNSCSLRSD